MANEIISLRIRPHSSSGGEVFSVVFLYPISPVIVVVGVTHVPTPTADIGDEIKDLLTGVEVTAMDDGSMTFEIVSFTSAPGETDAQIRDRARADYAGHKATHLVRLRRSLAQAGQRATPL